MLICPTSMSVRLSVARVTRLDARCEAMWPSTGYMPLGDDRRKHAGWRRISVKQILAVDSATICERPVSDVALLFSAINRYVISWVRHANLRDCQHLRRVAIFSSTMVLYRMPDCLSFTKERHGSQAVWYFEGNEIKHCKIKKRQTAQKWLQEELSLNINSYE